MTLNTRHHGQVQITGRSYFSTLNLLHLQHVARGTFCYSSETASRSLLTPIVAFLKQGAKPQSGIKTHGRSSRNWPGFIPKLACISEVLTRTYLLWFACSRFPDTALYNRTKDVESATGKYLAEKLKSEPWYKDIVPDVCYKDSCRTVTNFIVVQTDPCQGSCPGV